MNPLLMAILLKVSGMEKVANCMLTVLDKMVQLGASDLFITVGKPPIMKVEGMMQAMDQFGVFGQAETENAAFELLRDEKDKAVFNEEGETDFSLSLSRVGRFRVNVFRQRGSFALTVRRVIGQIPDPGQLGILDGIMDLAGEKRGLVLVTGPAGCGKSTTLAALIDKINQERSCHILTLEDPIEYLHRHKKSIINQREIGTDSKSYAKALRSALRQAPDVILIGEMRDLETISIALTAAETGHFVLSTLHTIGAAKTIDRIIDVFPPAQQQQIRIQLSTVLQAVVSQQLLTSKENRLLPAFEIMLVNNAIRNMIRENKSPQIDGVIQMNPAAGMMTMDMHLAALLAAGKIERQEALLHAVSQDAVLRYLAGLERA